MLSVNKKNQAIIFYRVLLNTCTALNSIHRNLNTIIKKILFYYIGSFLMTTHEVINFHVPLNDKTHLHKYLVNIEEYCLLDSEKFAFLEKLRSKKLKRDCLHRKGFHVPFLFIMEPEELMFHQWVRQMVFKA